MLLDGESIHRLSTKVVATRLGILPQSLIAPESITVADLVARGGYPHQKWFRQWSGADQAVITAATGGPPAPSTCPPVRSTSCPADNANSCGSPSPLPRALT